MGYAIGFSSSALATLAVCHCIYARSDQVLILNELIDEMLRQWPHLSPTDDPKIVLGAAFEGALIRHGAFFKDISFVEEDEWRLVVHCSYNDKKFCFRVGKSMLIPYYIVEIAHDTWHNKIQDIMIGPCPHPANSKAAVEGLLMRHSVTRDRPSSILHGGHYPEVRLSTIPYRSW